MQALRIEVNNSTFRFCSRECAKENGLDVTDGEFVPEREFDEEERCSNCDIFLNDETRADRAVVIQAECGQKDRDAKILAQAQVELLEAVEAVLPYLPDTNDAKNYAATNEGRASDFQCKAILLRQLIYRLKNS